MRALSGSIITAGALIGLGLAAVGVGIRYQHLASVGEGNSYILFKQLDTPMTLLIVVLVASLLVGLATAFLGLAYHHERRHYERFGTGGVRERSTHLP